MKPIFPRLLLALGLCSAVLAAQAEIFICEVDDHAVFTQKKQGKNCSVSKMEGSADVPAEVAASAVPEIVNLQERLGAVASEVDDIKILPSSGARSVTNTSDAANPRLDIRLRDGTMLDEKSSKAKADELNRRAKIVPAPIIMPKPKVQLTRKQILQNEIRNEQTALVRAKAQLNVATKKGDQAKITRLTQAIRDREANIRAIQNEMGR